MLYKVKGNYCHEKKKKKKQLSCNFLSTYFNGLCLQTTAVKDARNTYVQSQAYASGC